MRRFRWYICWSIISWVRNSWIWEKKQRL